MNRWFGEPWPRADYRAPVCEDDKLRIQVPVGKPCYLCGVAIVETDRGQEMYGIGADRKIEGPMYGHIECLLADTQSCFGKLSGDGCDEQFRCGTRENALRVWAWLQTHPLG